MEENYFVVLLVIVLFGLATFSILQWDDARGKEGVLYQIAQAFIRGMRTR